VIAARLAVELVDVAANHVELRTTLRLLLPTTLHHRLEPDTNTHNSPTTLHHSLEPDANTNKSPMTSARITVATVILERAMRQAALD